MKEDAAFLLNDADCGRKIKQIAFNYPQAIRLGQKTQS
jgi:hypothetical protein